MRVQVHPHRLITTATSEEEKKVINQKAGEVGEAAEVLLNPSTVGTPKNFAILLLTLRKARKT